MLLFLGEFLLNFSLSNAALRGSHFLLYFCIPLPNWWENMLTKFLVFRRAVKSRVGLGRWVMALRFGPDTCLVHRPPPLSAAWLLRHSYFDQTCLQNVVFEVRLARIWMSPLILYDTVWCYQFDIHMITNKVWHNREKYSWKTFRHEIYCYQLCEKHDHMFSENHQQAFCYFFIHMYQFMRNMYTPDQWLSVLVSYW